MISSAKVIGKIININFMVNIRNISLHLTFNLFFYSECKKRVQNRVYGNRQIFVIHYNELIINSFCHDKFLMASMTNSMLRDGIKNNGSRAYQIGWPRKLKSGNRKKHTDLAFSIISYKVLSCRSCKASCEPSWTSRNFANAILKNSEYSTVESLPCWNVMPNLIRSNSIFYLLYAISI